MVVGAVVAAAATVLVTAQARARVEALAPAQVQAYMLMPRAMSARAMGRLASSALTFSLVWQAL